MGRTDQNSPPVRRARWLSGARPAAAFITTRHPRRPESAYIAPNTFTVGDVGYLDEEGYLFLTARSVEIIVSGGVNIYPAEVESVLQVHPSVHDAVVFGVPDDEFGERVHALIEPEARAGVDPATLPDLLDRYCREHLAGFKVPRSYEMVESVPREPTGKVAKAALREPYWREAGRRL